MSTLRLTLDQKQVGEITLRPSIPKDRALLCLDCERIHEAADDQRCPSCGSMTSMLIAPALDRQLRQRPARRARLPGVFRVRNREEARARLRLRGAPDQSWRGGVCRRAGEPLLPAGQGAGDRGAALVSGCRICDEVGGPLVVCVVCGMRKHPMGRDPGVVAANGYCGFDCPGYTQDPRPGGLWPNERYGDSLGHMSWHEEAAQP